MSSTKITFVIPSRNNLEFLQLAYDSIRRLDTKHEVLVLNDASTDGTAEWIDAQKDEDLIVHHNPGPERIGIVGMFDKGIEMARTDIIMAFHADMVVCRDFDTNILKYLKKGTVVSATRVEPPLHPDGPEKILRNFGIEVEEFKLDTWLEQAEKLKEERVTEGIFAPWCMYREDFLAIGGHDELFAPQSKEDSDLFNRFVLNGYEVLQSWDALVYHFTSRGSRFNKHAGGAAGKNSDEWLYTTEKNMRNFIRKWGSVVLHDSLMKPIIKPKYSTAIRVFNATEALLRVLEPWGDTIYVDLLQEKIDSYIQQEQPNTAYDLTKRIVDKAGADITVRIDGKTFGAQDFQYIQMLPDILKENQAIGKFKLGNIELTAERLIEYQDQLINLQHG